MSSASISLYFDVEEGNQAELKVAAASAIAFAKALEELAFHADPSMEVRVVLESGTSGSLSLNTVIKSVRDFVTDRQKIQVAIISALMAIAVDTRGYTF